MYFKQIAKKCVILEIKKMYFLSILWSSHVLCCDLLCKFSDYAKLLKIENKKQQEYHDQQIRELKELARRNNVHPGDQSQTRVLAQAHHL